MMQWQAVSNTWAALVVLTGTTVAQAQTNPVVPVPGLVLTEQVVALDPETGDFSCVLRVKNNLDAGVSAVQIGILHAQTKEALRDLEAGRYYHNIADGQTGPSYSGQLGEIGVVRHWQPLTLDPQESERTEFHVPIESGTAPPGIFVAHLLGYRLEDPPLALLLSLLDTDQAADEVAALAYVGMSSSPPDFAAMTAARERLHDDEGLLAHLHEKVLEKVSARPRQQEAFERAYLILALGVAGGAEADSILESVEDLEGLDRLDEPLQVLRAARLTGSPLETALAFALPIGVRVMGDVVTYARKLAQSTLTAPESAQAAARGEIGGGFADELEQVDIDQLNAQVAGFEAALWDALWKAVVAGAVVFLTIFAIMTRIQRKKASK